MTDWAIPQQAKLKYTQLFNLHDRSRSGFLSGLQCRDILMQSGLPRNVLAEIWNLSDIDGDGQLTREEFILAMHLTNQVRAGQTLPQELPADLVPPSYRRTRSTSATSVHSTASAASSASSGLAMAPVPNSGEAATTGAPTSVIDDSVSRRSNETSAATGSMLNSNSFEDKRRENFEKGRAELERRRLKMIEQQSSVISEQLVKCKKQVADAKSRIDSMRSERDTKAGLMTSLEAQLKTVRDRKAFLDQEELQIIAIARDLNLVNSSHSAELDQQATKAKQESINQMKEKLLEMERDKENNVKQLAAAQAKLEESKKSLQSVMEEANKIHTTYKEKVEQAKVLREQFVAESKSKPIDLDSAWDTTPSQTATHADAFKTEPTNAFTVQPNDDPWATTDAFASSKPAFEEPFAFNKNDSTTPTNDLPTNFNNNNDSNFEPARDYSSLSNISSKSTEQSAQVVAGNSFSETSVPEASARKKMYRVVYEFEARNPDELTISPGDIVVGSEVVCEPGWLSGEANGKSGLFPEAYVEPLPDDEYPAPAAQPLQQGAFPDTTASATAAAITPSLVKYKVIYAFEARNPDELTITPGDIITGVDAPHEPGWLMGELSGQKGLFPEAYVERVAETAAASMDQASIGPGKSRAKKAEVATVIANYRALGQEQLNLEKGQLVLVRRKMDSGWWEGELQIKDRGSSNGHSTKSVKIELDCLINELLGSEHDYVSDLRLCYSAYIHPLSKSFDVSQIFSDWSKLIERHEWVLRAIKDTPKGNVDRAFIFDKFLHLLEAVATLYVSFCSRHNESARQLETKMASDIRFRQLVNECERKLRKLAERQEPKNATQAPNGSDKEAGGHGTDVSRALRNSNLPLTAYLLKPMQRITKYGLLFERMLRVISSVGQSRANMTELERRQLTEKIKRLKISAQELCERANEACRMREDGEDNVRRLRWCQSHIKQQAHQIACDSPIAKSSVGSSPLSSVDLRLLSSDFIAASGRPVSMSDSLTGSNGATLAPVEQISFNSTTNYLGPRRILKAGSVTKLRSGRELMLLLFNDFLLLAQAKGGGNHRTADLFRSERAQQTYYKLYKPPIMLEDLQLDNYDNDLTHLQTNNGLVCPSLNSASHANSLQEQESILVNFLDRHTGVAHNLIAVSAKEKSHWDELLGEHVARAKDAWALARRASQVSTSRPLSVSECTGRLFVTVLELVRVTSSAPNTLTSLQAELASPSWDRRMSGAGQLDQVQNLSVRVQLKLYKRTQMILDDYEKCEVMPTSDRFQTRPLTISSATRQPAMVDMNESMSNLDLQRDVFRFENENTQFLLAANSQPHDPSQGTEYLEIELVDESRFRETRQLGRKRVSLDQLLGRGEPLVSEATDHSSLARKSSTRSVRNRPSLQPNRPVEMVFKLKSLGDTKATATGTGAALSLAGQQIEVDSHKYSVKLKLHLQLFCDINSLI